ncbi:MAG TPA: tRNA 2-thiouridine(34) synthase MnmA [Candidatus Goldiibacteriota bacterium]|nr:tRNA 2-thiouridine(34) synthase MnmA [Candidatus Goldiibacteriota bacterium]HPN64023.1 tRNA 2-thiouridine(34) synthase MnmA [Candidatus Goldiibacteriota bacterium]HRQ42803.1 tRNA 2-thiouridine(34) synthase MnmA [Candidatus Goldiibacteriota bacterium]
MKIIIGMSGGADSTAAAWLLKQKGHELTGITLSLWDEASRCCNIEDIMDAKAACAKLGIRHYTLNLKTEFREKVVEPFIDSYFSGETPNPCVLCNEEIKFAALIKKMKELSYDKVATGHYARTAKKSGQFVLKAGKDKTKTQEYFLARLKKEELKNIIFPLGNMEKKEIKEIIKKQGLLREKPESQEVCFLSGNETPFDFIKRQRGYSGEPGGLYLNGKKIKTLDTPYFNYTIGQRKGLNYSAGKPVYVVKIDADEKKVFLGEKEETFSREFSVKDLNVLYGTGSEFKAAVKIRYLHKAAPATVKISGNNALIVFSKPQFAVTPGQLAVIYRGGCVAASGFISGEKAG